MTISEMGSLGELIGSILTLVTVAYLAVQVRQNTAQQRREELVAIQQGQNSVISQIQDPRVAGGFARGAAGSAPSIEDRMRAQNWVLQYLNHFEIVHDNFRAGSLDEAQYQRWASFAVCMVAPVHIRSWWDNEDGKLAFSSGVREMIDERLNDTENPPTPMTELWSTFSPEPWEAAARKSQA